MTWVYLYTCMCSLLMRSAALDSWYDSQLLSCWPVAGDPICPRVRPGLSRLMTHSSPSGGRVSDHDEPVCHFHHESPGALSRPTSASAATSNIHPLHNPQGRIIKLKQKDWWTYIFEQNVEKTKTAMSCAFLLLCFYREGKSRNLCLLNIKLDLHCI